jgi:hypothetical protein
MRPSSAPQAAGCARCRPRRLRSIPSAVCLLPPAEPGERRDCDRATALVGVAIQVSFRAIVLTAATAVLAMQLAALGLDECNLQELGLTVIKLGG